MKGGINRATMMGKQIMIKGKNVSWGLRTVSKPTIEFTRQKMNVERKMAPSQRIFGQIYLRVL